MEGWVQIKTGCSWKQRYGFISKQGSFRYFDDQTMTELKRDFRLKDVQIVQDRMNKIIKLQGSNESLQIKTDLNELWYQKLIQAKVQSMNISYIPQFQDQVFIRMNEQIQNVQLQEQQNIDPNDAVSALQLTNKNNTKQYTNMQLQRDQYYAYIQQNQIRTNQLQNQNQVFQEDNRQNGLQQLAQNLNQQITSQINIPQSMNPSNQIQQQNNLKAQNRTNQLQNQNQVFQEENKQNGLQQLAQYPNQQITRQRNIPQSMNPSNQIQPQNDLDTQNRTNQLQNQNHVFQEENRQNEQKQLAQYPNQQITSQINIPQSMNPSNQIQPQKNLKAQNRTNQLQNQNQVFQEENKQNGLQQLAQYPKQQITSQRNIPQSKNPKNQIQQQNNLDTQNRTNQLQNQSQVFQKENKQNGLQQLAQYPNQQITSQRNIPQSMNPSNQIQPQKNLKAQNRTNQLQNQSQVFQKENKQNGLQQLAQYPNQQITSQRNIPQSMNPSNQIQLQNNLKAQNRTNQLQNQNQVFQEENKQNGLQQLAQYPNQQIIRQTNIPQSKNPNNQIQPQNNLDAQNRTNQLQNQNQVFQEENKQNGLQQLAQYPNQQIIRQTNIPQSKNPNNQIQPQNNLDAQNRTNQLQNQNQVFQEENKQNGQKLAQYPNQQIIRQTNIPQSKNPNNQIQQQNKLQALNRTNQLQNQNQVFQEENKQNGLQQLAQYPNQQIIRQINILQSMNPNNQIQPQNNLNAQNNQNKREVEYKFEKDQQQQKKDQGVFSNIKDSIIVKKEDYYDEKFVLELNSNINLKRQVNLKIDEIIVPIVIQTSLFNQEQNNSTIQYNSMQYIQLQNIFDQQRNTFPIKISLSIFLMLIIVFNLIQWQKNQLIYTFCSIVISQLYVLFQHLKSKQVATKYNVQAFTAVPLNISEMYTINQLLEKLCQINKNIIIFEKEKNKELLILDKNIEFESVYQIQIKDSTIFSIKIFTKNYEYLDSIIENFTQNFTSKTGIWKESQHFLKFAINSHFKYRQSSKLRCRKQKIKKKFVHLNLKLKAPLHKEHLNFKNQRQRRPALNQNPVLDVIEQKMLMYFSKYQVNKENQTQSLSCYLYVIFNFLKDNWQFLYEIFCLIWLLLRLKNQVEQSNWSFYSNWSLLINYGITFTKLTFYLEEIFLSLRTDITINEKAYNYYYKKDIYKIAFNQEEIQTQDKINHFEVLFLCATLLASFVFRDSYNVIQIILLSALKPILLNRYFHIYLIIFFGPFVIVYKLYKLIFRSFKYSC
ncbi:transmembrane protein, putative (macronuclear) [Tetrahymena thermophila SB210]|uniref:Transmembrane protein, putative n=1 Tax=Tetrahymena thermophila (strain SB210) TaxID=312017 RepID=W7XAK8_TETTS|nr:transmembrane protein, putative [Tetrahymena thermophila SB210]EWS73448.1 transmembrane protein, putative [Tetrahymena thermophila SB210]|eukprot:XP_012654019.1 transmembrane protein, putative [Tetrahymena thermophila SB210]